MAYRRVFGYNKWESVRQLICMLGRLDLVHLAQLRRILFLKRLEDSNNLVMRNLLTFLKTQREYFEICTLGEANVNINCSIAFIKSQIKANFNASVFSLHM